MNRCIVLILGIVIAILLLKYRVQIRNYIGDVPWAEKVFGSGGTHTLILIIALLVFIGSLMYSLGTLQTLLYNYLGPFFGV